MDKKKLIRQAVKIVASVSVGVVVNNVIKSTTPEEVGFLTKGAIFVGGFILTSMVGDLGADYLMDQIDEVAEGLKVGMETA